MLDLLCEEGGVNGHRGANYLFVCHLTPEPQWNQFLATNFTNFHENRVNLLDRANYGYYSQYNHTWSSTMNKSVSVAEAKASLSQYIRDVEGGKSVLITRHGKPVAALVPAGDLEHLQRLRQTGPEGGLASLAGGWEDSDDLVRLLEASDRVGQREVASLD